jgi:hypothetical protein
MARSACGQLVAVLYRVVRASRRRGCARHCNATMRVFHGGAVNTAFSVEERMASMHMREICG